MRIARHVFVALTTAAMLALLPDLAGSTSAQDATTAASPEATRDCTATLGQRRDATGCLAFVHASPGAPTVDVYLNGEAAVTGLAPNTATLFMTLAAGDYLVQIVPTGGTVDQAVITVDPLTIVAARAYEVVALDELVDIPTGGTELRAAVFDVSTFAVPASGAGLPQSRVRIVHAVTGGKAIDAALIGGDIATPLADDVEFGAAGDYLEVPAGTYWLTVAATWGENLLDVPTIEIAPDAVTTIYVVQGDGGATGLDLLVVSTAASRLPGPGHHPESDAHRVAAGPERCRGASHRARPFPDDRVWRTRHGLEHRNRLGPRTTDAMNRAPTAGRP